MMKTTLTLLALLTIAGCGAPTQFPQSDNVGREGVLSVSEFTNTQWIATFYEPETYHGPSNKWVAVELEPLPYDFDDFGICYTPQCADDPTASVYQFAESIFLDRTGALTQEENERVILIFSIPREVQRIEVLSTLNEHIGTFTIGPPRW